MIRLRGTAPMVLIFEDLVHFLTAAGNFGQSILWIWSEMFQGTQKCLQFYLSGDHCCEGTDKTCAEINIFYVLSHK